MSSLIKKLLSQIQQLCVDISLKPNGKYYAHLSYSGHVNTITISYDGRKTSETIWIYTSEKITLNNLKSAKRKLKKLLEEK